MHDYIEGKVITILSYRIIIFGLDTAKPARSSSSYKLYRMEDRTKTDPLECETERPRLLIKWDILTHILVFEKLIKIPYGAISRSTVWSRSVTSVSKQNINLRILCYPTMQRTMFTNNKALFIIALRFASPAKT